MNYDYIIAGAGCAGLSLLYRILNDSNLKDKRVLVVDKERKKNNDRTWCYWEKQDGLFESIVRHEWKTLEFKTESFVNQFELHDYKYKMIKGIDFYNYVLGLAQQFKNVEFRVEEISSLDVVEGKAILKTNISTYEADYLFNSTNLINPEFSKDDTLLQHFMGWEIELAEAAFDPTVGTLMDFSLDQRHGTTFMYFLPVSSTRALVEYTLFTGELLDKDEYRKELRNYIENKLALRDFSIVEEEYGIIPMSLKKFAPHFKKKIINIGTAGGHTKASSGYTFQFIQKYTEKIIKALKSGENPTRSFTYRDKMFQWYDRTLLEVLLSKSMDGKHIFSMMFKNIAPEKILKFLANETNFLEDVKIMNSLPITKFLPAGVKQMFNSI